MQYYMNIHTGSVDAKDGWNYENEDGETVNAVDRNEVVPVGPDYCIQNNGDCETCSLVNYGRDCRNNAIGPRPKEKGKKPIKVFLSGGNQAKIELKSNNLCTNDPCPMCGVIHSDAEIPLWFFLAGYRGGYRPLCADCVIREIGSEEYNYIRGVNTGWFYGSEGKDLGRLYNDDDWPLDDDAAY